MRYFSARLASGRDKQDKPSANCAGNGDEQDGVRERVFRLFQHGVLRSLRLEHLTAACSLLDGTFRTPTSYCSPARARNVRTIPGFRRA